MAVHKIDTEIVAHLEWIGFVRPTGLVVSAPALVRAGAILDRRDAEGQRLLRACLTERVFEPKDGPAPFLADFRSFADSVLGWSFSPKGYSGTPESQIPTKLEVLLPDYGETLRPDFAVRELEPKDGASAWQLLVRALEPGEDFDRVVRDRGRLEASAQGRMERLLRQTGVPAGLLFNGRSLRLVSAPRGESSGWLDFRVADMVQTGGRPICTAMRLLLGQTRLLSLPRSQRLGALLEDSRKFQNEVSEKLAEQVLHALYEFLRGFQAAHDASKGDLLRKPLHEHPDEVYRALLTVILRLVFTLFAEERDMLPEDETFLRYYSLAGLYERLREDAALFPDTMDQRYGAWAQLLVLFRMIHDGAVSGAMRLPQRHGVLFDPDRFKFLEGRSSARAHGLDERLEPPLVPDGTIYRALEKLLVLDGERISYRALDVEQIGSIYETMMGFRLETATGRSVAIKADKKQGAPTAVDLEALLAEPANKRENWLQDRADRKLSETIKKRVLAAATLEDLHAALLPVIDLAATPDVVTKGAMVLQPSEERRRSGSHYTPRALTQPIVRTTLEPILARLRAEDGGPPRPAQILDLKVCDPAMGSGAFLVEACRQLGDALIEAWHFYSDTPVIPADEDEVIFARRIVSQRCLYGVDKNPVAVDLAKVSLWLATLAKDHPFTFLDHSLRAGDSLVGLSRKQIAAFDWNPAAQMSLIEEKIRKTIDTVSNYRKQILLARDDVPYALLKQKLDLAEGALSLPRQIGDGVMAAFFAGEKKDRENLRIILGDEVEKNLKSRGFVEVDGKLDVAIAALKVGNLGIQPFHWEIEFPEVFDRANGGFDTVVGNPPFAGKNTTAGSNSKYYADWLRQIHVDSHGNADLVAHFFRRAFNLIRNAGAFGLIATNTIGQGDTRRTGLRWICQHGGEIFGTIKRFRWPGRAAVVVSIVHVINGKFQGPKRLNGRNVDSITAFLVNRGGDNDPLPLKYNSETAFIGYGTYSPGFTFEEGNLEASSFAELERLLTSNGVNREAIFPYIGGEEFTSSPTFSPSRYAINFGQMTLEQVQSKWPDLLDLVRRKVKPYRDSLPPKNGTNIRRSTYWWQFGAFPVELNSRIVKHQRVLFHSNLFQSTGFGFVPASTIIAAPHNVILLEQWGAFAILQSRVHEFWARLFGSSMKDDPRYTPTSCFETFPFPQDWQGEYALETIGRDYHQYRSEVMIQNNEGLTKTYNRFHDPNNLEPRISKLRELHTALDRAVLAAYGWSEVKTDCEFLLDHEMDEEELGNKKKPWHYRWPDDIHDEVLARLLQLNAQRAKEEELSGAAVKKKPGKKPTASHIPKQSHTEELFS